MSSVPEYVRPLATSIREFLDTLPADPETPVAGVDLPPGSAVPSGYPGGTPVPVAKRSTACGWCDSTHIADVTCTCKEPCARGWCPARVDLDSI